MAGIGTRLLTLEVDGDARTAEVSVAKFTSGEADSDFVTFEQAAQGGGRQYNFEGTMVQDGVADSLWDLFFTAPGSEVEVTIAPYGNATPSPSQPHFTATCVVKEPDGDMIGGEADVSTTARMVAEVVWPCLAKPVRVTA
ncbi:MAG TPA: hypothetical protein VIQ30_11020 [Pseudonocardia sp.]